jgi:hypothetical protein
MTMQAMSEMLEKASTDETFTKGLVEAVGEKQGDQAIAAVTEYGTTNGFAITAEDVAEMQRELLTAADGFDGDLDDADLEGVSGGMGLSEVSRSVKGALRSSTFFPFQTIVFQAVDLVSGNRNASEAVNNFFKKW